MYAGLIQLAFGSVGDFWQTGKVEYAGGGRKRDTSRGAIKFRFLGANKFASAASVRGELLKAWIMRWGQGAGKAPLRAII